MSVIYLPVESIEHTEDRSKLLAWYEEEKLTENLFRRFRREVNTDYYDVLEKIWKENPSKYPLSILHNGEYFNLMDGWHRLAIAIKHNIQFVPCIFEKH